MSFICEGCNKAQKKGKSPRKVLLESRTKVYPERRDENDIVIDRGGRGWEIVREAGFCNSCYANSLVKGE